VSVHRYLGSKVNDFVSVFRKGGFNIPTTNRGQYLITAGHLYDDDDLTKELETVIKAMRAHQEAVGAVETARAANDAADVEALWGQD
jgi:hypothetical protein